MALWSFRERKLILSFGFGSSNSLKTTLPVSPSLHLFSHSFLVFLFSMLLTVLLLEGFSGCSFLAPSLASLSALSLPCKSQWPGIHYKVSWIAKEVSRLLIVTAKCSIPKSVSVPRLSKACKVDKESVKITTFAGFSLSKRKCCSIFSTA